MDQQKNQIRVVGDQGKLKWFRSALFSSEKPLENVGLEVDDPITDDFVDVHIEFDDGSRYWTTFTTPERLARQLDRDRSDPIFEGTGTIFVKVLELKTIQYAVSELLTQGRLTSLLKPF